MKTQILLLIAGLFALILTHTTAAVSAQVNRGWPAVTRAGTAVTLSPEQSGKIRELPFEEGQTVKAGEVVLQLENRIEELRAERLRMQVEKGTKLAEAERHYAHAVRECERVQGLVNEGVARDTELQTAKLELSVRELALQQARLDERILKNEHEQAKEQLAQRAIRSPIDGVIEHLRSEVGETVERFQPTIEVISLEPLRVEFDCPIEAAASFTKGTKVYVRRDHVRNEARVGVVEYNAQQADASSHTLKIRIRLPNPKPHWRAGVKVWLDLEKP
ncbi:MAG: hypothetical protein CSA62_00685 [Planctomycetota bacterium]|nr:MAG: hypothetical protein CSA62_00685 [Planctomycetota bacterium]